MEIVVDGKKGWSGKSVGATLGSIIETIRTHLSGRSIVSIALDGEPLTPQRQAELAFGGISKYTLLEVRTADGKQCARETVKGLQAHLKNIEKKHAETMRLMDAGEFARVTERFAECYGAWDTLGRGLRDAAKLAGVSLRSVVVGERHAGDWLRTLGRILTRLRGAMDLRDVVRMGDLVERDLIPGVPMWRRLVDELARRLGR